jgi:hypothetical protein
MNPHEEPKSREQAIEEEMKRLGFETLPKEEREGKRRQMEEYGITGHPDPTDSLS